MKLPTQPPCARFAFVLALPLLAGPAVAGNSLSGNELFVGHSNAQILKGAPSGTPADWTTASSTPRALLAHGSNLLVGTADGQILRLDHDSGALLGSHSTGLAILDMAIHDERLLVSAGDNLIHVLDIDSGQELGSMHPNFPLCSVEVTGDRVYSGSADGHVEYSVIGQDQWTTVVNQAPGAVTDLAFGGEVLYFTSENCSSVFIMNDEESQAIREFVMYEFPTSLAVTGQSLLVGTSMAGIYDYDVPSFFTNGVVWVGAPIISMLVNHRESVGNGYCAGEACPCGNNSQRGGCANSTGLGAQLKATGNVNTTLGDVDLQVSHLPVNSFALVFMGQGNGTSNFGDGRLCVGGQSLFRYPVRNTGAEGMIEELGVTQHSLDHFNSAGQISAGSTWNFQAWYRDTQGSCGSGFNTSNAWSLSFTE